MKNLLFVLFISVIAAANAQSPLCFGQPAGYVQPVMGTFPNGIISYDFNGDGLKDLATADMAGNRVCVNYGTGNGNFSTSYYFPVASTPYQLCAGDFNNDGKIDIATTSTSNSISILFGSGSTSFSTATNIFIGSSSMNILASDMNGDGKLDLAVCLSANHVSILLGSGTGSFALPVNYSIGLHPTDAVSGDFNMDGRLDLAVVDRSTTGNVIVLLGTTTGTLVFSAIYAVENMPESIVSADFNADGTPDLAITNNASSSVSVLFGSGSGAFATAVSFFVPSGPYGMDVADFNGDLKPDIAVACSTGSLFSMLLSSPTNTFAFEIPFAITGNPYFLAAGDYNSDGKMDLAATHNESFVAVWFNGIPIPTITVTGGGICIGQSFSINPSGALTYTFSGGSALVSPLTTTSYSISGTNTAGCTSTAMAVAVVTVETFPTIHVSGGTLCSGESFTLEPSGASTYTYDGGSSVVSPSVTTSYSITGSSSLGCLSSNTAIATIVINPIPVFTINGNSSVCKGSALSLIASGSAATYSWSNGMTGNLVTLSPTVSTTYTVTATDNNACSSSMIKSITVLPLPIISVNNGVVCANTSFTFMPSGAVSYTFPGGSAVYNVQSNTLVTLYGADVNGCVGSATSILSVIQPPNFSVTDYSAVACAGETTTLVASGANSYTWNGVVNGPSYTVVTLQSQNIYITAGDLMGCTRNMVFLLEAQPCVSVAETADEWIGLSIYPNPNTGKFTIKSDAPVTIKISNALGQIVSSLSTLQGRTEIDLTEYPNDIYFIHCKKNTFTKNFKVVKQN